MADNRIPKTYEPLIELMVAAAHGAQIYGATVGLVHNTEAHIRADLAALAGAPAGPGGDPPAQLGARFLWNETKSDKSAKLVALRTAIATGRFLARMCIRTLMPVLGESWNAQWVSVGLHNGSLAVPADPRTLLQQLRAHYVGNPGLEVANLQGCTCTAAACGAAVQAIIAAESARNQSHTDAGLARAAYEAAFAVAKLRLINLRDELAQLIDADDERWLAFGFEKPASPSTPDQPENVVITPGAPGSKVFIVTCDAARRAASYRFCATDQATGQEVANILSAESQHTLALPALAAGAAVAITLTARNAKGESQPTEPIIATVP